MRKFVIALVLVVGLVVTGCVPNENAGEIPADEPRPREITQQEAEALLLPVFEAAGIDWLEADAAVLDPLMLNAFSLREAVLHDMPVLCSTLDELGALHPIGDEDMPEMSGLYEYQQDFLDTMPDAIALVEAADDAGVLALAREEGSFDEMSGRTLPANPQIQWLVDEYLLVDYHGVGDAAPTPPLVTIESPNVVAVTQPIAPGSGASSVATLAIRRFAVELRDGIWKVVGLADYADTLRERDEQSVEYHGYPPVHGLDRWTEAKKEPTLDEALAAFMASNEVSTVGGDTTFSGHRIEALAQDDLGTWWAVGRVESTMSDGTGYETGRLFRHILHRHPWGWRMLPAYDMDGSVRREGLPDEVVTALEQQGVGFNDS